LLPATQAHLHRLPQHLLKAHGIAQTAARQESLQDSALTADLPE